MNNTLKNDKQLKFGIILSYVQLILVVLIGIIYTPFELAKLGTSEYGVYQTCKSTIEMLSFLTLGMNSGYIKFYTKYKKDNDEESVYKLNGLYLTIFIILGTIALILGLLLTNNLGFIFENGLTLDEIVLAKSLMRIISINLFVTFINLIFASIISAHEKFIFLRLFTAIQTIASPLINVFLLSYGYRSKVLACTILVINILLLVAYIIYTLKVLKQKFIFKNYEKGIIKGIFAFSSLLFINVIVDSINFQSGKIIVASTAGSTEAAIYSVGALLLNYFMTMSFGISQVFTPRVHKMVALSDDNKNKRQEMTLFFTSVGRIQYMILFMVLSGFVFFGLPFLKIWLSRSISDPEMIKEAYFVTLILLFGCIVDLIQNVGIEFQRSQNKYIYSTVVYAVMAIINVVLSIYLAKIYGALGAAIGSAITMIISKGFIMNIIYHKIINIDVTYFWMNILKITLSVMPSLIYGVCVMTLVSMNSIISFVSFGFGYIAIYLISLWFVGMNREEKVIILHLLNRN